jgi:hypothetical protein
MLSRSFPLTLAAVLLVLVLSAPGLLRAEPSQASSGGSAHDTGACAAAGGSAEAACGRFTGVLIESPLEGEEVAAPAH